MSVLRWARARLDRYLGLTEAVLCEFNVRDCSSCRDAKPPFTDPNRPRVSADAQETTQPG